jgi:hypothetical protein
MLSLSQVISSGLACSFPVPSIPFRKLASVEICNLHLDLPDGLRTSFIIAIVGYIRNLYS